MKRINSITPPKHDYLATLSRTPYFRDAIQIIPKKQVSRPEHAQLAIFGHMPKWVSQLMRIRNSIVKHFGFDVGQLNTMPSSNQLSIGDQVGFMQVIQKNDNEIISHAQDKHMDFYLSTKLVNNSVVLSTMVNKKTLLGRCYVNFIIPFHYIIARAVIKHALNKNRL